MHWLKDKLRKFLFPQLLNQQEELLQLRNSLRSFKDSADREKTIYEAKLKAYDEILNEKRRLTLEDIQLNLQEKVILKSCDSAFRHALYKSGEHVCLTTLNECCRKTAIIIREYQRDLTLSDKNRVPIIDDKPIDLANERSKKFFKPHL